MTATRSTGGDRGCLYRTKKHWDGGEMFKAPPPSAPWKRIGRKEREGKGGDNPHKTTPDTQPGRGAAERGRAAPTSAPSFCFSILFQFPLVFRYHFGEVPSCGRLEAEESRGGAEVRRQWKDNLFFVN